MNQVSRRQFVFASSGAAAGSLLVPGLAAEGAEEHAKGTGLDFSHSGLVTAKLKPLKHKSIPGFLSAEQMTPHHTAHYGGALKAFIGIEARFEDSLTKGTAIDTAAFETLQR